MQHQQRVMGWRETEGWRERLRDGAMLVLGLGSRSDIHVWRERG